MRANKKDFELHIASNEVPKDLDIGLIGISIFKGNIVLRFAASDDGCGSNPIISKFNIECLDDSRKELEKKLSSANIEIKPAQKLVTFIVEKILDKMGQAVPSQEIPEGVDYNDDGTNDKVEYIYKYSKVDNKKKKKILHEAVILTSSNTDHEDGQMTRRSVFLCYDKDQDKIKAVPTIVRSNRILKPADEDEYQYIPYTYDMDIDQANLIKEQLKHEKTTIESFYKEALELVRLFTVQDHDKQVIIAANVVGSYFQDKFPTCHYLAVTGKPGSGKTSIGHTFGAIGYRPIYQVDPSAPNILRTLGKFEPGQSTLIIDEADKLAMSSELMTTIKTGYEKKGKTPKINQYTNKPEYFHSFCFKLISAERIPREWKTDGVLDRTLHWISQPGISQYDIKEVLNEESRNAEQQAIFDRIIAFRKKMMIYRLVHFADPVTNIDVGVAMRDKELVKPLLQLFYNSKCGKDTLKEIVESLQSFLDDKNEVKTNSIDEVLFGIISNSLPGSTDYTLLSALIWKTLIETLEGPNSYSPTRENKQNSEYEFSDYGVLYKTTIIKNIVTMFGAQVKHTKSGNAIVFSKHKVENLIKMRNERRIKVSEIDSSPVTNKGEGSEGSQYSEGNGQVHDYPRGSAIGEGSEGSEGSIEGPTTFIEVYHGNEENRIEVFPSICSQITRSYSKDSTNINNQSSIIEGVIVGYTTGGASVMPSLPSLPSPIDDNIASYPVHVDYSSLEPNQEIKFTPDYKANEPVFWHVFKELADANNGRVIYYNLQERLISTGKLDAGGSVLMIEQMERTGKIEKTGDYNIYRIGKLTTKEEGRDYTA
jgi:hypothetical protein